MSTTTVTDFQANFLNHLSDLESGAETQVFITRKLDEEPVARALSFAEYDSVAVDGSDEFVYVPESEILQGPASLQSGLYTLISRVDQASAIPDNTIHATYVFTGGAGGVTYEAVRGGEYGNDIKVAHVVSGFNTPLSVSVSSLQITVNIATDGRGLPTSTMAQVASAVNAHAPAAALVTALATGTTTEVAATPFALDFLTGGQNQPSDAAKFQALAVYRTRNTDGTITPEVVIINNAQAAFLGL